MRRRAYLGLVYIHTYMHTCIHTYVHTQTTRRHPLHGSPPTPQLSVAAPRHALHDACTCVLKGMGTTRQLRPHKVAMWCAAQWTVCWVEAEACDPTTYIDLRTRTHAAAPPAHAQWAAAARCCLVQRTTLVCEARGASGWLGERTSARRAARWTVQRWGAREGQHSCLDNPS
jgi:hypothetical protein